jgi:spore coat protein U-like protein
MNVKKSVRIALLATAGFVGAGAGGDAVAAGTATGTLNVSAEVVQTCAITNASQTVSLDIGTYDVLANAAAPLKSSAAVIHVTCTSGSSGVTIDLSPGVNPSNGSATAPLRVLKSGGNSLTYNIYSDSGYLNIWGAGSGHNVALSAGTGADQPTTVYGMVDAAQNPPIGTYTDIVGITVNY